MSGSFFINRPVLSVVISIFIMLSGIVSIFNLPVAQFPEIAPPQIFVEASYPGASASVVENTVVVPIEQQLNGVEHMLYMSSTSANDGSASISITFEVGTNVDQALIDVSNRIKLVEPKLPEEVRRSGISALKKSSSTVLIASLQSKSPIMGDVELSNYAAINILDELKRVNGVGDAKIMGAKAYSMRIWLKPDRLSFYGLTVSDVVASIREQNSLYAVGKIGQIPTSEPVDLTLAVATAGRLVNEEEFGDISLKSNADGSSIKLRDVASIQLGAEDYETYGQLNGSPATLIAVYPQPGANILSVAEKTINKFEELSKLFPSGVSYSIPYDTTRFVKISIDEVVKTLFEAICLVFLVVYLFLQNWRATLIPCLAVPVSIIGTFAGIYLLGFSINTLTLFGLVLAIGIVVDDAIVVLENVERIMKAEKLSVKDATIKAMSEVTGPVIAIVLVLCAVFIPVSFLGGMTGQLYKQFAVTITISVVISGIVALTLTPVLCVMLIRNDVHENTNKFFLGFNSLFEKISNYFSGLVEKSIRRGALMLFLYLAMLGVTYSLFQITPKNFVPKEDQGYLLASINLPDAASITRTQDAVGELTKIIKTNPAVKDVISYSGFDILSGGIKSSAATIWVTLRDWDERKGKNMDVASIAAFIMGKGYFIKEASVIAFNVPSIPGLGTTGGFEAFLQNRGNTQISGLSKVLQDVLEGVKETPQIRGLNSSFRANVPQLFAEVDKQKAKSLGVPLNFIYENLSAALSPVYVNDFNKFGKSYKVLLQADAKYKSFPEDINKIYVKSLSGQMIPMSAIVALTEVKGVEQIDRFNGFAAARINGEAGAGYSMGEAMEALESLVAEKLPKDFIVAWSGESYQQKQTGNTATFAFIFGVIAIFLILAAQYEQWSLPIAVLLVVPFALLGALVAISIGRMANDIYFQVGIITLIGLSAKNAILIVEFANLKREEGHDVIKALIESVRLRFKPIIMTSLAFILGVLPLLLSSGAGANSRHSIGAGVFGGMIFTTFIGVIFVPVFYYWVVQKRISILR
ncbi:MAG: transporter [Candidatus Midichloriaceae bacterium]|jgi:hydrophobe/amphiphile efflux-1 (HAE1) family protein|nr:transporter [Candidatus Midichloriaceae bacterium]